MIRYLLLVLLLAGCTRTAAEEPLRVAVAANFRATLEKINLAYRVEGGPAILLSSASTGVLATQLRHGAPFDLFLSADHQTVVDLRRDGLGVEEACYAIGQLALVGGDLSELNDPRKSLAIANPQTAPYGRAAAQVLSRPELAAAAARKPVRGASVLQAYQFWRAGAVDLALVAASQAPAAQPIPGDWYAPLQQSLLVLHPSPATRAYLQWLGSDTVRQMIIDAGYLPCP
ncbi:molybdate ABC transporter substrate-binding protein [Seongchinamella unica]|uniref:Molybdate ABC transporter substrate-binding protein n=1 Tax=Seongchinamella unica TaxID=2547392 RepID=A0A4R5LWQ9_9GAMM|nr:molybdate ABC transporter substrate-binding protein [Seongchinamella unica]TDG15881.1 molybdate ABC transporter substrate-binding protein [Seongchinamella unica]